ncbi:cysteine--tRNA ligase [Gilvimarinus sp. F26214L]|uniref:cysteine--tRNA ligase n=1 Tax=Gilvimarinus sp. DZF01 TaxID=3461371 RepID=UPI004045C915
MTQLYLTNTRTKKKEIFQPMDPKRVTMYVCGPTVYNYVHIGNARPVVVFDTLFRVLRSLYDNVVYARNITDIDDKIMQAAREEGTDIGTITERYTEAYHQDMAALGSLQPTIEPRATDHLPQMIAMMETLIAKGHAYVAEGHVLFDVESMPEYGQLSNRKLEDMLAGARVEVAGYKKHPGDFVLWKPSSDDEPGWDSPWGRGRPGWHTECVVMIESHLGPSIDIHGGGKDLVFPHHENELAQSHCVHDGATYVRYWLHNAFINMDGEKMSKSLGNVRTVRDLLGKYRGEVLRFAILSAHYRSELDFSKELLDQAKASLDSLYTALRDTAAIPAAPVDLHKSAVFQALLDDLNTPIAISALHQIARDLNKADADRKAELKGMLLESAGVLGLLQTDPEEWFKTSVGEESISADRVEALIAERKAAKTAKEYARADEIREQLKEAGIILEDSRSGTTWRRE